MYRLIRSTEAMEEALEHGVLITSLTAVSNGSTEEETGN
jgi:hypothetical protein